MINYDDKVNELSGSKIINDLIGASTYYPINISVTGKLRNEQLKMFTNEVLKRLLTPINNFCSSIGLGMEGRGELQLSP